MPPIPRKSKTTAIRYTPERLLRWGEERAAAFCKANEIPMPGILRVPRNDWQFDACAFYRADTEVVRRWSCYKPGINICLEKCARPALDLEVRNWNWPGSVTDRTPYGVIAHELGHHCDHLAGERKGSYYSEYGESVMKASGEKPLTSYAPNPSEWFAEMFRLFVTNHALLYLVRPKTWDILIERWVPVSSYDYEEALGPNIPRRILNAAVRR